VKEKGMTLSDEDGGKVKITVLELLSTSLILVPQPNQVRSRHRYSMVFLPLEPMIAAAVRNCGYLVQLINA
jgi:hypothetical protein